MGVARQVRPHRDRPDGQLIPGQEVAGEGQAEGQEQQDHPDHPVELPGRLVRAGVEHPGHVEGHREHHEVGPPSMDVPDQVAEDHAVSDVQHVRVRGGGADVRGGAVEEHQVDAGHRQQDEQEERQSAQAERVGQLQPVSFDLDGVKVVHDVVHHGQRPVALGVLVAPAEHGAGPEHRPPEGHLPELVERLPGRGQAVAKLSPGWRGWWSLFELQGPPVPPPAPRYSTSASTCWDMGTAAMVRAPAGSPSGRRA